VFQGYLDRLAQRLTSGELRKAGRFDEVRVLARARALGVSWKLDANRKRSLMQFLHEARLIRRKELDREAEGEPVNPVIGLSGADLRGAYLKWLDLRGADLQGDDLKGTLLNKVEDTEGVALVGADLRRANFRGVDLGGANLQDALVDDGQFDECKSLADDIMPNGKKF
jgi:uncharacterized protein YjbI with pentapeptide repeats